MVAVAVAPAVHQAIETMGDTYLEAFIAAYMSQYNTTKVAVVEYEDVPRLFHLEETKQALQIDLTEATLRDSALVYRHLTCLDPRKSVLYYNPAQMKWCFTPLTGLKQLVTRLKLIYNQGTNYN